ncbi:MAG: MetQ/NlpA family ABC transporter substrate-binding protein [Deltaproteobacteria bacterium]|jgi:D-methionine transport system substrate-binding protein|nr:MetQ/NlpA family ABC transporter substrate-binding protein [Deltaproteobacteria bacterium]
MKNLFLLALGLILFTSSTLTAQTTVTVGTTSGADVEILEKAKEVALKDGLEVKIIEFGDYRQVNEALVNKELDLNAFQHQPYLDDYNKENGTNLVSLGSTYISPLGFYSRKIKKLDELKNGDTVAIPNDPTNGGRALLLLQKAGAIKLKTGVGLTATPYDIVDNPKSLVILEVDAAQTPRTLEDVAAAAINNTFSIPAGLNPVKDSIYLESVDSPYVNVIASRLEDKNNQVFLKFVKAYQSQEVADFIYDNYEYSTIPAFPHKRKDK